MNLWKKSFFTLGHLSLTALSGGALVLSGCIFGGEKEPDTLPITNPVQVSACTDLSPSIQKTADSLVELATVKMTSDMEYVFSDSVQSWDESKERSSKKALALFDQALEIAPGHCGAKFGRAVASTMMLNQDSKLDAFVKKMDAAGNTGYSTTNYANNRITGASLFKLSPDQAAPVLLKLSANIKKVDYPTVTDFQSLAEGSLLPKLDSTIAALEAVMNFDNFSFEFTNKEGQIYQLDQGDIGPVLAALKIAKAFLTIAVGYQWEISTSGKYDWFDSISTIHRDDFDHLRPGQRAALDQYTGLIKFGSAFSKIKPLWRARVNNIPNLLLSAVNDAQKGLKYSIAEATNPNSQDNDIYIVGTGDDADVDPADLQRLSDLLERTKKYLTGEVPLSYNKGKDVLKVNFPKLFQMDGVQSYLPYFEFARYEQWNDPIGGDTTWSTYFGWETEKEVKNILGYDATNDYRIQVNPYNYFQDNDTIIVQVDDGTVTYDTLPVEFTQWQPAAPPTRLATLVRQDNNPCAYSYTKYFDRVIDNSIPQKDPYNTDSMITDSTYPLDRFYYQSQYKSIPPTTKGILTISGCREKYGTMEYAQYADIKYASPAYFTDSVGNKTIDFLDVDDYADDISALKTKIIFRDPTFGGVFPELTQANIWAKIKSLQTIQPRSEKVCTDIPHYGYYGTYFTQECHMNKARNPSDLDLLIENLDWFDSILSP